MCWSEDIFNQMYKTVSVSIFSIRTKFSNKIKSKLGLAGIILKKNRCDEINETGLLKRIVKTIYCLLQI